MGLLDILVSLGSIIVVSRPDDEDSNARQPHVLQRDIWLKFKGAAGATV